MHEVTHVAAVAETLVIEVVASLSSWASCARGSSRRTAGLCCLLLGETTGIRLPFLRLNISKTGKAFDVRSETIWTTF